MTGRQRSIAVKWKDYADLTIMIEKELLTMMKVRKETFCAMILCMVCSLALLNGCGFKGKSSEDKTAEKGEANVENLGEFEMADKDVQVIGIVLDAVDSSGSIDEEAVENAKLLAEKTGAAYPFLIPDSGLMNGRLSGIDAIPETFFVDTEGNIVGETYVGAHSFDDWKGIVEKELEGVKK